MDDSLLQVRDLRADVGSEMDRMFDAIQREDTH
jgi:hypothetical protein